MQKLIALVLAIIIWYIAIDKQEVSQDTESQVNIPIIYRNLSKNFYIVDNQAQSVTINYNVRNKLAGKINLSEFQVIVDLKNAKVGENFFSIGEKDISKPTDVVINRITPSNIQINLEEKVQRHILIKPQLNLLLDQELVIGKIIINPEFVSVTGPKNVIDRLQYIATEPIDVTGDQPLEIVRRVKINFPKLINASNEQENNVTIKISLSNESTIKKIEDVPVELINETYVTRFNPKVINVVLKGTKSQLEELTKENIKALIDLNQKKPSRFDVTHDFIFDKPFEVEVQKVWPPVNIWILNQDKEN